MEIIFFDERNISDPVTKISFEANSRGKFEKLFHLFKKLKELPNYENSDLIFHCNAPPA
jgi:hypothetical protein